MTALWFKKKILGDIELAIARRPGSFFLREDNEDLYYVGAVRCRSWASLYTYADADLLELEKRSRERERERKTG